MNVVTQGYVMQQTMCCEHDKPYTGTNHWFALVHKVLGLSGYSRARLMGGEWVYPADAVKKVLGVAPVDLEKIIQDRSKKKR